MFSPVPVMVADVADAGTLEPEAVPMFRLAHPVPLCASTCG